MTRAPFSHPRTLKNCLWTSNRPSSRQRKETPETGISHKLFFSPEAVSGKVGFEPRTWEMGPQVYIYIYIYGPGPGTSRAPRPPKREGGPGSRPEDHEQRRIPLPSLLEDIITSVARRSLSETFENGLHHQPMIDCACIENACK